MASVDSPFDRRNSRNSVSSISKSSEYRPVLDRIEDYSANASEEKYSFKEHMNEYSVLADSFKLVMEERQQMELVLKKFVVIDGVENLDILEAELTNAFQKNQWMKEEVVRLSKENEECKQKVESEKASVDMNKDRMETLVLNTRKLEAKLKEVIAVTKKLDESRKSGLAKIASVEAKNEKLMEILRKNEIAFEEEIGGSSELFKDFEIPAKETNIEENFYESEIMDLKNTIKIYEAKISELEKNPGRKDKNDLERIQQLEMNVLMKTEAFHSLSVELDKALKLNAAYKIQLENAENQKNSTVNFQNDFFEGADCEEVAQPLKAKARIPKLLDEINAVLAELTLDNLFNDVIESFKVEIVDLNAEINKKFLEMKESKAMSLSQNENELTELRKHLVVSKELEKELAVCKEELGICKENLSACTEKLLISNKDLSACKEELSEREYKLQESINLADKLTDEVQVLKEINQDSTRHIEEKKQELVKAKEDLDRLLFEVSSKSWEHTKEEYELTRNELQRNLDEKIELLQEMKSDLLRKESRIDKLECALNTFEEIKAICNVEEVKSVCSIDLELSNVKRDVLIYFQYFKELEQSKLADTSTRELELKSRSEDISGLESELKSRLDEISTLDLELKTRLKEIDSLQLELKGHEATIGDLNKEVETLINEKQSLIEEKKELVKEKQVSVKEAIENKDQIVAKLREDFSFEKQQLALDWSTKYQDLITENDSKCFDLSERIALLQSKYDELNRLKEEQKELICELEGKNTEFASCLEREKAIFERALENDKAALEREKVALENERNFLSNDKISFENERAAYKNDLALLEKEKNSVDRSLSEDSASLKKTICSLENQLNEKAEELSSCQKEIDALKVNLGLKTKQNSQLISNLDKAENVILLIFNYSTTIQTDVNNFHVEFLQQLKQLKCYLENFESDQKKFELEVQELKGIKDMLVKNEGDSLKTVLDSIIAENRDLLVGKETIQNDYEFLKAEMEKAVKQSQLELQELRLELNNAVSLNDKLQTEKDLEVMNAKEQLEKNKQLQGELKDKVEKLRKKFLEKDEALQKEIKKLNEKIKEMEVKFESEKLQIMNDLDIKSKAEKEQKSEIEQLNSQMSTLKSELEHLSVENELSVQEFNEKLVQQEAKIDSLNNELALQINKTVSLESDLIKASQFSKQLEENLTLERKQLDEKAAICAEMDKTINEQKIKMQAMEADFALELNALEENLAIAGQESSSMKSELNQVLQENAKMKENFNNNSTELNKLKQELDELKKSSTDCESLNKEISLMKSRMQELMDEGKIREDQLRIMNKTLKDEIRKLEKEKAAGVSSTNLASQEYLKHVVLKFMQHPEQRAILIPVVCAVFSFTKEEVSKIPLS